MTQPTIFLASSFALLEADELRTARLIKSEERATAGHYNGHVPPNPDQLGGTFNFSTLDGRQTKQSDFTGHWTLFYFGYARCTSTCPMAIPAIATAAKELRQAGINTRASFVDIEAPALGNVRRRAAPDAKHPVHLTEVDRMKALRNLQSSFGSELQILTGTRGQLAAASIAFQVAREHTPPRDGERGHSINHSSLIYILDPRAKVAGYGYHTSSTKVLVETVQKLRRVKG
ncbi:SCO family protein [Novosphingobium sp. MW5]|nr:SCO family protein [Novosphingobium sp. MW5]